MRGASALILPSLFEESILASEAAAARFLLEQDIGFGEAGSQCLCSIADDWILSERVG